jgi:hypothetical protein
LLGVRVRHLANAVQGFECSGIFQFNRNRLPGEKFLPSEIFSSLTDTNDDFVPSEKG